MYLCLTARKIVAAIMLLLTLNVMVHGFVSEGTSDKSFKNGISQLLGFEEEPGTATPDDPSDFKPPKHSFIDYTTFFGGAVTVPAYLPVVALMTSGSTFQYLPTIYDEITVPPDNCLFRSPFQA